MSALRCEAIALLGSRRTSVGADRSEVSAKHQTDRSFAGGCRRSIRPWTHRDVPFGGPADGPRASPLRNEPDLDRPPAHEERHPGASRPGKVMIPEAIADLQDRVPPLDGPADNPWASPAQGPHTNAIEIKWFSVPSALAVVLFFYTGAFRLDHRGPREHRERRMGPMGAAPGRRPSEPRPSRDSAPVLSSLTPSATEGVLPCRRLSSRLSLGPSPSVSIHQRPGRFGNLRNGRQKCLRYFKWPPECTFGSWLRFTSERASRRSRALRAGPN